MTKTESDLQSFNNFVIQQLAKEETPPTLPELFELWQTGQPEEDPEYWETVASLKRAYGDINNPERWRSPYETIAELRRELNLPEE